MIKAVALLAFCGILTACATTPTTTAQPAAAAPASASATKAEASKKKVVCTNEKDEEISSRIAVRRVCRPVPTKDPSTGS